MSLIYSYIYIYIYICLHYRISHIAMLDHHIAKDARSGQTSQRWRLAYVYWRSSMNLTKEEEVGPGGCYERSVGSLQTKWLWMDDNTNQQKKQESVHRHHQRSENTTRGNETGHDDRNKDKLCAVSRMENCGSQEGSFWKTFGSVKNSDTVQWGSLWV